MKKMCKFQKVEVLLTSVGAESIHILEIQGLKNLSEKKKKKIFSF